MTTDQHTRLTCPAWCQADHDAQRASAEALDAEVASMLGRPVDTSYVPHHTVVIGTVSVEAGADGSGLVRDVAVVIEKWHDLDAVVRIDEPTGEPIAREDYSPAQAARLATLLLQAAEVASRP